MIPTTLEAALRYARRGWPVFPCHQPVHGHCSCRHADCASPAKHPRTQHGLHEATTDPVRITGWWQRWPDANVGVCTGSESGLVVIDVDRRPGGLGTLTQLERMHGQIPSTAMVMTGTGRHYWFAHPGGTVRNSAGRLGPGIDVRADGGYVIAPPSSHISGRRYRWAAPEGLAPLPEWVVALSRTPAPGPVPPPSPPAVGLRAGAWAHAALNAEIRRVRTSLPGGRNHALNRAAFGLGQLVAGGYLQCDDVRAALHAAGASCGLLPKEVRATVASGLQAGFRQPRHPRTAELHRAV